MCNLASKPPAGRATDDLIDLREQLWNEGLTGPAGLIQVPTERITRLRGILLDLDPAKLIAENPWFPPADDPLQFHANTEPILQRHPLARQPPRSGSAAPACTGSSGWRRPSSSRRPPSRSGGPTWSGRSSAA